MTANGVTQEDQERKFDRKLWLSMLGAPVLWLIYLQGAYVLVQAACRSGQHFILHAGSGSFLALTIVLGGIALGQWTALGRGWPDEEEGGSGGRRRAMAMIGILQSALFAAIIVASWAAMMILDPCEGFVRP
jgi:hypothetical protein